MSSRECPLPAHRSSPSADTRRARRQSIVATGRSCRRSHVVHEARVAVMSAGICVGTTCQEDSCDPLPKQQLFVNVLLLVAVIVRIP